MYKPQDTVELVNELNEKGYENLRKLGELQMSAWNGLVEKQMAAFNLVVDSAVAQVTLTGEGKEPQELLRAQIELNRKLADDVTAVTRESVELVQQTGEQIRTWAEDAMRQAGEEAEKVSEKVAA
jgi:acetolactate synthase regulatory subunit